MALLSAVHLSKSYGAEDIFSDISFSIPHHARIGLVGPNGVGKTTLLRLLIQEEEASGGTIQRARGIQVGYLPQEAQLNAAHSLWQECLQVFSALLARQKELTRLEAQMSQPDLAEQTLETYGRLQQEFEHLGGYTFETRIRMTLTGLGFQSADLQRPITQLSGGQRTRALLARLLLEEPDLLLLDEPTNHLDIAAVEWLESYLKDWPGAVLIVSHDRYFLDQVVTTIFEMSPAMEVYRGNYSAYLTQRSERYTRRLTEYQNQQEFIEKEEDYIRRNIAGQNTRQAQGRRKRLERMLEETRLAPPKQSRNIHFRLQAGGRSGDLVLRTYGLAIGYADEGKPLFQVPDLLLERTECAALLGPNGAGKTTFLKTILGQIPPYDGESELGSSLKIGYFAQAHEDLHLNWTLIEEINAVVPKMLPAEIRDYLAKFLFTGDDVFKQVSLLSGGERGRLALACLALKGSNLLLLDEPTNHLDLPSQELLQSILADFQGTILLVSHDRYLIDALATQVWEVRPDEKRLTVFDGTYSEFKAARQAEAATRLEISSASASPAIPDSPLSGSTNGSSKNEARQRQKQLEKLEVQIHALEAKLDEVNHRLENPPADPAKLLKLAQEYQQLQDELNTFLQQWEEMA